MAYKKGFENPEIPSERKNEYYSYKEIDRTGANYRIIIGERSNGKTYGFKKKAIDNFLNKGEQFAYLRRNVEEIKLKRVSNYFEDLGEYIKKQCQKKWPEAFTFAIIAKQGEFKLYSYDEMENSKYLGTVGYYFALNQTRYDKSNSYPDVTMICFEEFLVKGTEEIRDEFTLFLNFVSTIKRKRTNMIVYLLGNTVNRNSQILQSMGINVRQLKQGSIRCYEYFGEDNVKNTVAVEYCRHYEQSRESEAFFTFGNQKEMMITKGTWETESYPLFTEAEFWAQRWKRAFIFDSPSIRIFIYLSKNNVLYVTEERMINHLEYLTFTTEGTNLGRSTFTWN